MMTIATDIIAEDDIRAILRLRRARNSAFGEDLFSDPAWDILLQLYGLRLASARICLSELSLEVGVPESVTARWVAALEKRGLVVCRTERQRPMGLRIGLSSKGAAAMKQLLEKRRRTFETL
jgi:DNA-binding MarR family transcriptional regulator